MKYFKYGIIENAYKSITYSDGKSRIRLCKTLHKTNSKLVFYLMIFFFKIQKIEYDVVNTKLD